MIINMLRRFGYVVIRPFTRIVVDLIYKGFWNFRKKVQINKGGILEKLYYEYLRLYGAWIGIGAEFDSIPILPHGLFGIFISHNAHIGKNVVIFQQVTIGSNTTIGSSRNGSPTIGNNVYIGCGAKIIGKLTIGENVRIGANCVCVKDVPANSVVVLSEERIITKIGMLDNKFVSVNK